MSGRVILHVEDNEYNRKIVRDLLSKYHYEIVEAQNGQVALDAMALRRPDLILMDVQLPKISGLEVTRLIKADPTLAEIPVIAITSFAMNDDNRLAIEAGCNGYLAKPFQPRDLLEMIERLLGH